ASRLDAQQSTDRRDRIDLLPLAIEESARAGAEVQGADMHSGLYVEGDERLLRRALRNLLENASRYGGDEISVSLNQAGANVELRVCDRGPGVPEHLRERIFE